MLSPPGQIADSNTMIEAMPEEYRQIHANVRLVVLKQFYRRCEARDWVDRSAPAMVAKKKVGGDMRDRDRVLRLDEMRTLQAQLAQANPERKA